MEYTTPDGKSFTDEDIKNWADYYEQGEALPNSRVTKVILGKPAHTKPQTTTITVKVPIGMKTALANKAKQQGITTSAYIRNELLRASL